MAMTGVVLIVLLNAMVTVCGATSLRVNNDGGLDRQQVSVNYKAYLLVSFCATLDADTEVLSLGVCPYQGFSTVSYGDHWYTPLPDNASELNDYMCGSLNRKGRLCSECKDGYIWTCHYFSWFSVF